MFRWQRSRLSNWGTLAIMIIVLVSMFGWMGIFVLPLLINLYYEQTMLTHKTVTEPSFKFCGNAVGRSPRAKPPPRGVEEYISSRRTIKGKTRSGSRIRRIRM